MATDRIVSAGAGRRGLPGESSDTAARAPQPPVHDGDSRRARIDAHRIDGHQGARVPAARQPVTAGVDPPDHGLLSEIHARIVVAAARLMAQKPLRSLNDY
jgi:hypothetical protein